MIATITCFCGLSEIRQLASSSLERWLSNPAIVDHVKKLLCRVAECLQIELHPVDSKNALELNHNGAAISGDSDRIKDGVMSSNRLIPSDMNVVKEIVKLRSKLKPSQIELYRNTLILIAKKGFIVAKLIIRCAIYEDLLSGDKIAKADTTKLLLLILNSLGSLNEEKAENNNGMKGHEMLSETKDKSDFSVNRKKGFNISQLIGESIGDLCTSIVTNNSMDDDTGLDTRLNDIHNDPSFHSDQEKNRENKVNAIQNNIRIITPEKWTPVYSKLILDLLYKILKSLGLKDLDLCLLYSSILGSADVLASYSTLSIFNNSYIKNDSGRVHTFLELISNDDSSNNDTIYSSSHPLQWEVTIFYAEISILFQLLVVCDLILIQKSSKELATFSTGPSGPDAMGVVAGKLVTLY